VPHAYNAVKMKWLNHVGVAICFPLLGCSIAFGMAVLCSGYPADRNVVLMSMICGFCVGAMGVALYFDRIRGASR
jgi:hypothetical protein